MLINGDFKDKYGWEANEKATESIQKSKEEKEIDQIERELKRNS